MTTSKNNYYEILEIQPGAAQHEVTSAYERARTTYSGENAAIYTIFSEQEARQLLSMIEEAYSVLGNKAIRAIYDTRVRLPDITPDQLSYEALLAASRQKFSDFKIREVKPKYEVNESFEAEIRATTDWNGSMLKKVREYKNLSLDQLNVITKVSAFYIAALEDMNPEHLPAMVFVRGYVVQVAKALGLDERKVADSYMKLFRQKLS